MFAASSAERWQRSWLLSVRRRSRTRRRMALRSSSVVTGGWLAVVIGVRAEAPPTEPCRKDFSPDSRELRGHSPRMPPAPSSLNQRFKWESAGRRQAFRRADMHTGVPFVSRGEELGSRNTQRQSEHGRECPKQILLHLEALHPDAR